MLKEPRRKYLDFAFLMIISLCLILLVAYQVNNVVELNQQPTPTATPVVQATAFQRTIPEQGEEVFRPSPTPAPTGTPAGG